MTCIQMNKQNMHVYKIYKQLEMCQNAINNISWVF